MTGTHGVRSALLLCLLVLAACSGGTNATATTVLPIEDILASEIVVEPDPSGTVATLRVETDIPVACAVAYGPDDSFGLIATDDDMAGGAHSDHSPLLSGLQPDTEYVYVLQGSDAAGNLYRSDVRRFRTPVGSTADLPGPNVAADGQVTAVSSEFSGDFAAANATDGDLATAWSTAGDGDDAFLTIDVGDPVEVAAVRLRSRGMTDGTAITESYSVTVDEGRTYGPFPADTVAELDATGSRFRFDANETTGGNTGAVEVEIYASG